MLLLRFLLFASILSLSAGAADLEASDRDDGAGVVDRRIGRIYLDHALTAYREGRVRDAGGLAAKALLFDPLSSDALFLQARLEMTRPERFRPALSLLRQALQSDRFELFPEREARELLAEASIRIGDPAAALSLLARVPSEGSARAFLLTARALSKLGRKSEAVGILRRGVDRYPSDLALRLELLKESGDLSVFTGPARAGKGDPTDPAWRALLLQAVRQLPAGAEKRRLLGEYFEAGGDDPAAAAQAVLAWQDDRDVPFREILRFERLGGFRDPSAVRTFHDALVRGNPDARYQAVREFLSRVSGFSGAAQSDSDADGYHEERYLFQNGTIAEYRADRDQDGIFELQVFYRDGLPERIERRSPADEGRAMLRIRYAEYPEVLSAELREPAESTVLDLVPGAFSYPVLNMVPAEDDGYLPEPLRRLHPGTERGEIPIPGLSELGRHAYRIETRKEGAAFPYRVLDLERGMPVLLREDRSGDGKPDYELVYRDGIAELARRDADFDGNFELTEYYREGLLSRLDGDTDGDGIVDFRRDYLPPAGMWWRLSDSPGWDTHFREEEK